MKAFLWQRVDGATDNYHDQGGLLVIAETLEAAREAMRGVVAKGCEAFTKDPDRTWKTTKAPVEVFVFPDSGCC